MIGATRRIRPISPSNASRPSHGNDEGDQPRRARRRLDDEPARGVARAVAGAVPVEVQVVERPRRLHRPAPHLDVLVEERADDADRVEPQVAARGRVVDPRPLEHDRRPQRAGREDDLRRPDDEPPRDAVDRDRRLDARGATAARPRTRSTGASGTIRVPWRQASARCTRMPDCFAPRRQPKPHRPQSPQSIPFRRISPTSWRSIVQPRRMSWSLGGTFGASETPISAASAARSASSTGSSKLARPWLAAQWRRVEAGGSMHVIQLTSVPPPTPCRPGS